MGDHDTEQAPTDLLLQGYTHQFPQSMHNSRQHASWSEKSKSNVPQEMRYVGLHPASVSYHAGDMVRPRNSSKNDNDTWRMNGRDLHTPNAIADSRSALMHKNRIRSVGSFSTAVNPLAYPFPHPSQKDDCIPQLEESNVSIEHDLATYESNVAGNKISVNYCSQGGESATESSCSSSSHTMDDEHSITNSNCVPVVGKLVDLTDNNYSENVNGNDNEDSNQGGIVILDEATEEEYDESLREFSKDNDARRQLLNGKPPQTASDTSRTEGSQKHAIVQAPIYETDSVVFAASVNANANLKPAVEVNASLLDFEQLLREADDHSESDISPRSAEEEESNMDNRLDASKDAVNSLWRLNPFASSNERPESVRSPDAASQSLQRAPARATRISHDKYVVEIDIYPSDASNSRLDTRDVMDIMANIELLHLWFDAVPAVFDATIKDGGENGATSSGSLNLNPLEKDGMSSRQYDGQWVEISTPPLTIPSDSRLSGCVRAIRVGFRSLIGFPSRIRSMVFVERSCGRIGMTLGPYPDGFLCNSGTTAYHAFSIRMNDEESSAANQRRCIVVSDEVRLQRGADEGFDGARSSFFICSIFRFLFAFLEWALLSWYRPDLVSYQSQTISSLNKLRVLVERGESAAYSGNGERMTESNAWGQPSSNKTMDTPLLGQEIH